MVCVQYESNSFVHGNTPITPGGEGGPIETHHKVRRDKLGPGGTKSPKGADCYNTITAPGRCLGDLLRDQRMAVGDFSRDQLIAVGLTVCCRVIIIHLLAHN